MSWLQVFKFFKLREARRKERIDKIYNLSSYTFKCFPFLMLLMISSWFQCLVTGDLTDKFGRHLRRESSQELANRNQDDTSCALPKPFSLYPSLTQQLSFSPHYQCWQMQRKHNTSSRLLRPAQPLPRLIDTHRTHLQYCNWVTIWSPNNVTISNDTDQEQEASNQEKGV